MHIERMGDELIVQAPAKLNLFLEVLARRADGYHELETLMCPVGLYDTLGFSPDDQSSELSLHCDWRPLDRGALLGSVALGGAIAGGDGAAAWEGPATERPADRDNLAFKALDLLRKHCGIGQGARVRLIKRIPAAAGLAGGSSDAAAALAAGNLGWGLGLSHRELSTLAAELGSDVPFFLHPKGAICRGRGERIEPLDCGRSGWFVIVRPATGLSTAEVFNACRPSGQPRRAAEFVDALRSGGWERAGRALFNALEPAAERLSPEIARLRREFDRIDVLGHQMSGSGTSYFGVCRHAAHARQVAARLRSRRLGQVFAVSGCL